MKAYKFFVLALYGVLTLVGCEEAPSKRSIVQGDLALAPTMSDMGMSRASGDSFFTVADRISLVVSDQTGNYTYAYGSGAFRGINTANTYRFFMDNQKVNSITASWPLVRSAQPITDQRKDIDFKTSDYMTAKLFNIMATKEFVPIVFVHENAKVVFVVTGQNPSALAIQSLVVNIDNKGYWAHPDPVTGHAELIIPPGDVQLNADEIAGRITINGVQSSIIFQITQKYTLLANTSYVVTLSPRGDNIFASISIGGWYQDENGVGVPLIQSNGYYMIGNEAQLFAIAQLITNYKPNTGNIYWTSAKYMLSGNVVRSMPLRPWSVMSGFTGEFNYNSHTISPNITFANGGTIIQ